MGLSPTALAYLTTLERIPAVPVQQVADALKRANCPVFQTWLDFHSRFAGYVETIGRDNAVWGIMHASPGWPWIANEAEVEARSDDWYVVCADVHPSYDYKLNSAGNFISYGGGGSHETFAKKVEIRALFWDACKGGRSWKLESELAQKSRDNPESLARWSGAEMVAEASDKFSTYWRGHDVIIVDKPERKGVRQLRWPSGRPDDIIIVDTIERRVQVWVAAEARERLCAYQPDNV